MQGQKSAIGSLPDSINFDYGSSSSNVGIDPQICWNNLRNPAESRLSDYRISGGTSDTYMGSVSQEGRNLSRWGIGESSSINPENLVSHDEPMTQTGWSSSVDASVDIGLRLEDQRHEPTNLNSQTGVNLNLSSNQFGVGPTFVRSSYSGSTSQNLDLNQGHFHGIGDDMDCPGPNSSKSIVFGSKFITSASSSSDPFASSSGSGGFLVEEDDGRPGSSLDGRRLSCKRKTLEGDVGQSSSSAPPEQVNPGLGLGMGGRLSTDNIRSLDVPREPESLQRNFNLRINPSIRQDSMLNNSFLPPPMASSGHPDIPSVHQPIRFVPVNPPLGLRSPIPSDSVPNSRSVVLRVPNVRRNVQALRWAGPPNLRPGSSSSSGLSGERDISLPEDLNPRTMPRNIGEQPVLVPPIEARNPAENPTNWSLSSGNVGISRNIASSSRIGPSSGPHSSGPSWASHRHPPSQYSRRLSEYVRRSLLSSVGSEIPGQSSSNGPHRSGPASSQGVLPSGGGSQGHNQSQSRSALWLERQNEGGIGIPYSLRALASAGEGRSRLVSEIRNVLDIMRRGEGLRIEDVMILDQSVLFGMADMYDQHRDMRLDVDNMSYEELLALEDRIGNVCTGLSEETILNRMKQHKYIHTMSDDQTELEPCCVCQEEYRDGEDIGSLECGHDFHTDCIKQWLAQKNLCPICKTTGLPT